jgi:hypothetical protein
MRKRLVAIYSVLVIAIVLLAALVPGCAGQPTIEVVAKLCGVDWVGAVNYTLTPTGGSPISGTAVPTTHSNMTPGTWTCAYANDGSGPAGAFLDSITPSATQIVFAGDTITFTLNFERNQDAGILFRTWTINGTPIEEYPGAYYHEGFWNAEVVPCQIIDAHFLQWVDGCPQYNVTLNETSWLSITQTFGPPGVQIYVANNWCAVDKAPELRQKVSQNASINNLTVLKGSSFNLTPQVPTQLDVKTVWQLVKCLNYTKAINWFGISKFGQELWTYHPCVLFELVLPQGPVQQYNFTLQTSAEVALVNDVDVTPANNSTMSPLLFLTVTG